MIICKGDAFEDGEFGAGFRHDAHPMAIMCGVVGAFSAFYPRAADIGCVL